MTRALAATLLLVACADTAETLATVPCGWVHRSDTVLREGFCWLVEPAPGVAITEPGASACEASRGQRGRVWAGGQRIWVWTRAWATGDPEMHPVRVDCPVP